MKYDVCPNCGGTVRAESIGWKCNNCRGFISLQDGKFYEYVEKPFMPPMTNADRIRAMSDKELAAFLASKFSDLQSQQLFGEPTPPTATELRALSHAWYRQWIYWLKQPVEEETNDTT